MLTKYTTAFKDLPIGSKFLRLKDGKLLMKISSIIKDDTELNTLDMDKGLIFNTDDEDEVFWINVVSKIS